MKTNPKTSEQPRSVSPLPTHDSEAHQVQDAQAREQLETRHSLLGIRLPSAVVMATAVTCAIAAGPNVISVLTQNAVTKLDLMTSLSVTASTAILGLLAFGVLTEQERARHRAEAEERRQAQEALKTQRTLQSLQDQVDRLQAKLNDVGAAVVEGGVRRGPARPRARNGDLVLHPSAFGGAGPGEVTTLEPHCIEARIDREPSGLRVSRASAEVPEAYQRLMPDHPTTRWTMILIPRRDIDFLESLIRLVYALRAYDRIANYNRAPLDLSKLRIRVADTPATGFTTVVLPERRGLEIRETVLQYAVGDIAKGHARMAVSVRGPLFQSSLQRRDELSARSVAIPTGALEWLLGDCIPDEDGFVSEAAVLRWLAAPMPSLGQLANWQPDLGYYPD